MYKNVIRRQVVFAQRMNCFVLVSPTKEDFAGQLVSVIYFRFIRGVQREKAGKYSFANHR
jgi:hypothetical protein